MAATAVASLKDVSPPATEATATSPKLAKAAREFEAILLQSWLEKMNQSFVGSSESQDAAHDTVSSLGTEAMGKALAAHGGIGLASMLLRQLQSKASPTPSAHPEVQPNPAIDQLAGNRR